MKTISQCVVSTIAMTAAIAFTSIAGEAQAQERRTNSVEITMAVESDGTATVTNRVEWIIKTDMGGFDFVNPALDPITFQDAFVDLSGTNKRMPVVVKQSGNTWMLDTKNERVPEGTAFWTFTYKGNLIDNAYIGKTTSSEFGELYYFHWHPVQWMH